MKNEFRAQQLRENRGGVLGSPSLIALKSAKLLLRTAKCEERVQSSRAV